VGRELRWQTGVRCPYCVASRIHREGYTGEGTAADISMTSRMDLSRDDTKKMLKTVSEGEMKVNTDEYPIYECIIEGKT